MKWAAVLVIMIILSTAVAAYQTAVPVRIKEDHFYEFEPKVIEDKEFTNDDGNCIYIKDSEWVIIRGNYIHDCTGRGRMQYDGYAIYIEDVENLIIEDNIIENSHRGVYLKNVKHVTIRNNNQTGTYRDAVFRIEDGDDIEIYDNYMKDNGATEVMLPVTPSNIGKPDGRLQGIVLWKTDNAEIYRNTVINSSSDGIGIAGATKEDPSSRSHNFQIFENTLIGNGEQGIWLEGAQDGEIYDNIISKNKARTEEHGGSSGIMLQFDVKNFEIHDNTIEDNDVCGIVIQNSPSNFIYANKIIGNYDGGICLDGQEISLDEYWFVGNMYNRIHRNIFKDNHIGGIVIWSGANDETEVFYNNFDVPKDEAIQSRIKAEWKDELVLDANTYKQKAEKPVPELYDEPEESAEDTADDPKKETAPESEDGEVMISPEDDKNPLVAYSLLTLFFVLLVVAIILFGIRQSIKKK